MATLHAAEGAAEGDAESAAEGDAEGAADTPKFLFEKVTFSQKFYLSKSPVKSFICAGFHLSKALNRTLSEQSSIWTPSVQSFIRTPSERSSIRSPRAKSSTEYDCSERSSKARSENLFESEWESGYMSDIYLFTSVRVR